MRFRVALLGQFVYIDWVGVLASNSAKDLILGNVPATVSHTDASNLRLGPAASIDGGSIPLLHLGVG